MKHFSKLGLMALIPILSLIITSCGGDDDDPYVNRHSGDDSTTLQDHIYASKLKETSWELIEEEYFDWNTRDYVHNYDSQNEVVVCFTDDIYPTSDKEYTSRKGHLHGSRYGESFESIFHTSQFYWNVGPSSFNAPNLHSELLSDIEEDCEEYELRRMYIGTFGQITSFTDDKMIVTNDSRRFTFVPTECGQSSGGSNGTGGGSSNGYSKPEIGLESYDCYSTSITAFYRIYNPNEAKVSSARGYYGTSSATSSVNASSIGSSRITIRFTGLKSNTVYYIKCTATGKGGTSTSDVTRLKTSL